MTTITRVSPVLFDATPAEQENHQGWTVIRRYQGEGHGPWLVDLSHRQRWDFQSSNPDCRPFGLTLPEQPGQTIRHGDWLVSRMNRTQASLWHLGPGSESDVPVEPALTDITDGTCLLALVGQEGSGELVRQVMEGISNLDLWSPQRTRPCLTQGPVLHIPCQVVTLGAEAVVLSFSRGYGQAFAEAWLHSARPQGLRPGGEQLFHRWWSQAGGGQVDAAA
jgi:hypothetical protein